MEVLVCVVDVNLLGENIYIYHKEKHKRICTGN